MHMHTVLKGPQTVHCPFHQVIPIPSGGAAFVMENLEIAGGLSTHAATLGEQLARWVLYI